MIAVNGEDESERAPPLTPEQRALFARFEYRNKIEGPEIELVQ